MNKILCLFYFILFIPYQLFSQILPKEGSQVNYRIIAFSFPALQKASQYKIEIAGGKYNSYDSFNKNVILSIDSKVNKTIAEVPSFNRQYSWCVTYMNKKKTIKNGDIYHFSTGIIPEVDTSNIRVRVIDTASAYKNAYVFLDDNKALYDMRGHPVWYLPDSTFAQASPRDLKLSPYGTITFLNGENINEIDYNGEILWKGPNNGIVSGDSLERYHHQFNRLSNGNYMVLGTEPLSLSQLYSLNDTDLINVIKKLSPGVTDSYKILFGTLIMYNSKGNVIWSWKSSNYFAKSDIKNYIPAETGRGIDVHENAFFFNEKDSILYLGFRNISRIIKIKYPDGYIMRSYGKVYTRRADSLNNNDLFCTQHSLGISKSGYLYLFNNNTCNNASPTIVMMEELPADSHLKKIWEYECPVNKPETKVGNTIPDPRWQCCGVTRPIYVCFSVGGGDWYSILLSTGIKKSLWSAVPERWDQSAREMDQYSTISCKHHHRPKRPGPADMEPANRTKITKAAREFFTGAFT